MPPSAGLHGLTHLLAGETEWRNIQTIIKTTLQAVAKVVSNHAVMLETMDARIDRIQDAAMSAQTLPPPRVNNNDDGTAMIVSRKEFLALVADVCKMQKRAVSSDDVEVRVVASGNELKRRLEHTITPLQDALRDMEDMVTKQVMAQATATFATKDALRQLKDEVIERHTAKTAKMEHHMVTRRDLEAVEERVTAASKALHRTQTLQVKDSVGHLEQGLRKHLADHLAAARDELKKFKAQVDESVARTATDCHAHLRQRAMASDVKVVLSDKVDRAELDSREKQLEDRVGGRLDDALQQAVAEWKHEVAAALHKKCPKADVAKLLARKVNREDVDAAFADKVTHTEMQVVLGAAITAVQDEVKQEMQQIQRVLEGKLHDHGEMVAQHVRDLQHEQAQHADGWTGALEDIRGKVAVKMGIKDACTLLDTKCNVADVNDALGALQDTIHTKADDGDVQALVDDVTGLRKQLRGELCVGRWIWKTGRPTDRHTIAWTVQVVNTNPDVFAWEKGSDHVTAIVPGLYQLQASFFTDYAPTLQVLVNGEPAFVVQGEKGDALGPHGQRRRRRHTAGNVTGISLCDFLALPPRATVSVTYDIDERAQGFLTLRKL
ncbi:hypothetical protein, variant 1 [Aphanomyces invadans]|uniref:C1q domain-containing protein n=1 Tax=Aphanomyces invadans TaxID=157072 RepID=A0A024TIZ2_9STRA|nr:hypothetical protein, variant 1 [Aphanomyces invadans]ETV94135.1 hypothetical protein, variant 1 [Aphanomyces invadans]|eukprot:XP_008877337.1 hypothetical protein, variant 1 [Aphanomyces invadans]